MDQGLLEKLLKMAESETDTDALMGLRGLHGLLRSEGLALSGAVLYAVQNAAVWKDKKSVTVEQAPPVKDTAVAKPPAANITGVPECRTPRAGCIEIVLAGKSQGEVVQLPPAAAADAPAIAANLKDALVAAVINKSRFKIKILETRNSKGETIEALLQAEYERSGMAPIRVWVNPTKGEVALLAAVLRKMIASNLPELVAA
jgi:hypothetical protein